MTTSLSACILVDLKGYIIFPIICGRTQNGRILVDLQGEVDIAPLVSLIVREGAEVEEVRKGKASLEDVFLTLMEEAK